MANTNKDESLTKAQNTVFRLLKFRSRSEKEIREKLVLKKLPDPVIKQTIQYFKDMDLINDQRFARDWISVRLKKPLGPNRIRLELKKKGIAPDVIEKEVAEATDGYDEAEVVTKLAKYRASKYKNIDPEKIKQRVYNYLLHRGFSMNIIIRAIKSL